MDKAARQIKEHSANAKTSYGPLLGTVFGGGIQQAVDLLGPTMSWYSALAFLVGGAVCGEIVERIYHRVVTAPLTLIRDLQRQLEIYQELPRFLVRVIGYPLLASHEDRLVIAVPTRVTCEVRPGRALDFRAWLLDSRDVPHQIDAQDSWQETQMPGGTTIPQADLIASVAEHLEVGQTVDGYWLGTVPLELLAEDPTLRLRIECDNYKSVTYISDPCPIQWPDELQSAQVVP